MVTNETEKQEKKPIVKIEGNLYQKLAEIKKSVTYLQKTKPTNEAKYAYVSSSDVLLAIREAMEVQELLLIPRITKHSYSELVRKEGVSTTILTELDIEYTWLDINKPDDTLILPWYGQGVDISGEKGVGKALTYAEKYFFLKFFNIPTDKDDPDVIENRTKNTPSSKGGGPKEIKEPVNIISNIGGLATMSEIAAFHNKHINEVTDKGAFIKAINARRAEIGGKTNANN